MNTPFNAGKNHILDGSGSGSATVSELGSPHPHLLTRVFVKFILVCNKVIILKRMCLEVNSSFVIVWPGLLTCWCIIMHNYFVMIYIAVPIVLSGNRKGV